MFEVRSLSFIPPFFILLIVVQLLQFQKNHQRSLCLGRNTSTKLYIIYIFTMMALVQQFFRKKKKMKKMKKFWNSIKNKKSSLFIVLTQLTSLQYPITCSRSSIKPLEKRSRET